MDLRSAATQAAAEYAAASDKGVEQFFQAAERTLDGLLAWAGENPIAVVAGIGLIALLVLRRPLRR